MDERASALQHERHYTVDEANEARPWVSDRVESIRDAIDALAEPTAQAALEDIDVESGGAYPGYETARAVLELLKALAELEAKEIVLRDPEQGLVDFPSLRDGEEVYLCWLVDEDEVSHWHEPDAGFDGRRPLD